MIVRLLAATSAILGTQLLLLALFMGVGLLLRRRVGLRTVSVPGALRSFWVGFCLVLLLLMVWNFFRPIDGFTLATVAVAGTAGLVRSRRDFSVDRRALARLALVMVPVGLWMANISVEPLRNWDDGLYHLQGIRWAEEHPLVPGLANLFGPLGFNNAGFLYDALLDVGPWEDRAYHLANGLLVFAFLAQAVWAGLTLLDRDGRGRAEHVFDLALLTPAIAFVHPEGIASYVTGLPTTLVVLAALSAWFALITRAWQQEPRVADSVAAGAPERGAWLVITVGTLLAGAVCLKQNGIVLAATALPMAVVSWWVLWRPDRASVRRTLGITATLVLGLGLTWMGRGIVLSGYPLFPQSIAPMPVEWRAPLDHTRAELAYAIHSARTDTGELGIPGANRPFSWVSAWLEHPSPKFFELLVPGLLALIGGLVLAVRRARAPPDTTASRGPLFWMLPPIAVAAAVWFAVAPAPRYGTFLIWGAAALMLAQALRPSPADRVVRGRATRAAVLALFALGFSPALIRPVLRSRDTEDGVIMTILRANLNRPGEPLFAALPPTPELSPYLTESGLRLLVPDRRCFAAPLPCTPNPAPNLERRDLGALGTGFVVRGGWRMRDWPYWWRSDFLPSWLDYRGRDGPPAEYAAPSERP